jgi:Zn-dependent protease with chaperone function
MTAPRQPVRVAGRAAVPEPARPDVLAYPSPTTIRFVILVVATLSAGLFAGVWVHTIVHGSPWLWEVRVCAGSGASRAGLAGILDQQAAFAACTAGAERQRALYGLGGLAVSGIGGVVALYLAPVLLERRRRLRPAGPKFAAATERFARLAATAGLARAPVLMLGSAAQRDAFSYGVPAHYKVVLPLGVAIRPHAPAFAALAAHELAHVARRDVTIAWLARSVGYALVPVLALPVLLTLVVGDLSLVPDYTWRAVLLGAVIVLTRAAILRSREYDADLHAARSGSDVAAMSSVLSSIPDTGRRGARRLLANHPSVRSRIAVLQRPAAVTHVGFVDGLTAAFLAALTPPLIELAVVPLLTGTTHVDLAEVIAAVVAGSLVGGTLGLAFWRAALIRRISDVRVRLAPVVAGVFSGFVLGGAASLAGSGIGLLDRDADPLVLAVTALCAAGATVTTAGLGELWADAAGRLRSARVSWAAAVVLPGIVFAAVLWAGATTQEALQSGGWALVRLVLPEYFSTVPMVAAVLVLAVAAGWALWAARSVALTPAWLLESGPRYQWPTAGAPRPWPTVATGVTAGVAGAAGLIAFRLTAGAAAGDAQLVQRFYTFVFVAAAAAVAGGFVLAVLCPGGGAGAALLAVPIATTVTTIGFLALSTVLGGKLGASFVAGTLRKPLGLALLGEMLVLGVVVLPPARRRLDLVVPAAAALAALLAATTVIAARDALTPLEEPPAPGAVAPSSSQQEIDDYRGQIAPAILQRYNLITGQAGPIGADLSLDPAGRASAIQIRIVAPLRQLSTQAEAMTTTVPAVAAAHAYCVDGLRTSVAAYESLVVAYETGDPQALATAQQEQGLALSRLRAWTARVQAL